jgi:CRISPR/Cas system CSM-associated protein Csm2 small subunit
MIKELKRKGHEVIEKYPGIYYITNNLPFPAQIVVTRRLDPQTHSSLRILTKNAKMEDVQRFLEQTKDLKEQGEKNNVDAVLQASVAANDEIYKEVRRNSIMCEALRELMKDEFDEAVNTAETASKLEDIRNIMKNFKCDVEQAMDALEIPPQKRPTYLSKL